MREKTANQWVVAEYTRQMQTNKTILLVRSLGDYLTVRSLHGHDVCDRALKPSP